LAGVPDFWQAALSATMHNEHTGPIRRRTGRAIDIFNTDISNTALECRKGKS
jgi:hypothetical protein